MSERNRPTPEGRVAGAMLAEIADRAEPAIRAEYPATGDRCKSCAFRAGSVPNGCVETVLDGFACAISGEPFWCHQRMMPDGSPRDLCGGWQLALGNVPPGVERLLTPIINELRRNREASPAAD